jgi:hypothetical protein
MKTLTFSIDSSGSSLVVTPSASNEPVSQYEITKVVVKLGSSLDPSASYHYSVIMRLETPTASSPADLTGYSILMHLTPDTTSFGQFTLYLNEAIKTNLSIGDHNLVYYNFQIYRNGQLFSQPVSSSSYIEYYKTPTNVKFSSDDMSRLLVSIDDLEEKIK